jgi:hypothetical protein
LAAARAILRATAPNVGFYVVARAVAIVAPHVPKFGYLLIAVVLVSRAHGGGQLPASA